MDLTLLLAQIWGPVLVAVSLGMFVSPAYYRKIYRNLEKDTLAVFSFGMFTMALGVLHIQLHSHWNTLPEVIISLLGWGLALKGTVFIITPKFVDKSGDWWANKHLIPLAGVAIFLIGIYLVWLGFFADSLVSMM